MEATSESVLPFQELHSACFSTKSGNLTSIVVFLLPFPFSLFGGSLIAYIAVSSHVEE